MDSIETAMCSPTLSINIEESLKKLIANEGYLSYVINNQRITPNGAGFLGHLCAVDVQGQTKDGDMETNLFLKICDAPEKTTWVSHEKLFRNELFAYRELYEIYTELQDEAKVPSHDRYKMTKCYAESTTEAIIFENLTRRGFKMHNRFEVVPLEFAEMAMTELAKFHALSFVLQKIRSEYFNTTIKPMKYPVIFGDDSNGFIKNMIKLTMKYVDDDVKSKVECVYNELAKKFSQFYADEARSCCICHGDYRSQNMMIKTINEKLTDFMTLDYQMLYYGCPALDILYFFAINTDYEFRKSHLTYLKTVYHETLTTFLKYFNITVESVYSRETFEKDFHENLEYGILISFILLPLFMVSENNAPDDIKELSRVSIHVDDAYRDRQRGIVQELKDWGYI